MAGSSPFYRKRKRYYKNNLKKLNDYNRKWTLFFNRKYGFYQNYYIDNNTGYSGGTRNNNALINYNNNNYNESTKKASTKDNSNTKEWKTYNYKDPLTPENFLAYDEYDDDCWKEAENRAGANMTWYQSLFSGNAGVTWISFIVAVVILVVVSVLSYGTATAPTTTGLFSTIFGVSLTANFAISVAIAAVGIVASTYSAFASSYYSQKAESIGASASNLTLGISVAKQRNQIAETSAVLTNLIIYGGYAIYPNGAIYNKGKPGSETFSFDDAYDNTRGLRGDLAKENAFTENIHSRVGADAAGGTNFHQNLTEFDFPLKAYETNISQEFQAMYFRFYNIVRDLYDAMVELGNFNIIGQRNGSASFQSIYNRLYEKLTRPTKCKMMTDDFLYRIKNYNRDLRANFDYLNEYFFIHKERETKSEQIENMIQGYDSLDDIWNNENITPQRKAEFYIDTLCDLMYIFENFADLKIGAYYHEKFSTYAQVCLPSSEVSSSSIKIQNLNGDILYYPSPQLYFNVYENSNKDELVNVSKIKLLNNFFYKNTNQIFKGDNIIQIFQNFLNSFYKDDFGNIYCLISSEYYHLIPYNTRPLEWVFFMTTSYSFFVWNSEGYYTPTNMYDKRYYNFNFFTTTLNKELADFFTSQAVTDLANIPAALKDYDFSTIEIEIDNTDSEG